MHVLGTKRHHHSHHRPRRQRPKEGAPDLESGELVTSTASAVNSATSNLVATATTLVRKHSKDLFLNGRYSTVHNCFDRRRRRGCPQTAVWTVEAAAEAEKARIQRTTTASSA